MLKRPIFAADEGGICSRFASPTSTLLEDIDAEDDWKTEEAEEQNEAVYESRNTGMVIHL